jgi:hypothetical protein
MAGLVRFAKHLVHMGLGNAKGYPPLTDQGKCMIRVGRPVCIHRNANSGVRSPRIVTSMKAANEVERLVVLAMISSLRFFRSLYDVVKPIWLAYARIAGGNFSESNLVAGGGFGKMNSIPSVFNYFVMLFTG